jgi:hypothetical protein
MGGVLPKPLSRQAAMLRADNSRINSFIVKIFIIKA